MLTGKPAFGGDDVSDTLAAVVRGEPDWTKVPAEVPRYLRTLLRQCLEKNRTARIAGVAAVRFVLVHGATLESNPERAAATPNATTRRWRHALPWALAAACATALAVVLGLWAPWRQSSPTVPKRLSVELGTDVSLANTEVGAAMDLSPDGTVVAFVGRASGNRNSQLYTRRFDQLQAVPLPGTDDAQSPFFSADVSGLRFSRATSSRRFP
jgi:eukaryotic-like serine/threonine-protein kinase